MRIEDWLNEKRKLCEGDVHKLSRGSRILLVWWDLIFKDPAMSEGMKHEAERILNEREADHA